MKAFMSYRDRERGQEHRWCVPGFDWYTNQEVEKDAADAVQEARAILAESEPRTDLTWHTSYRASVGAAHRYLADAALAEALSSFLESE